MHKRHEIKTEYSNARYSTARWLISTGIEQREGLTKATVTTGSATGLSEKGLCTRPCPH